MAALPVNSFQAADRPDDTKNLVIFIYIKREGNNYFVTIQRPNNENKSFLTDNNSL